MLQELLSVLAQWSTSFVQAYGPYSVFLIVLLEELLLPIPSPIVLMGAGFLMIEPGLALADAVSKIFLVIVLPASLASMIGAFFIYGIGYLGGRPVINRLRPFLGISWDDVKKTEQKLENKKRTWITIALCRATPFFPIAIISLFSGVLRLSKKKFAIATFIGSIPRTFIMAFIGWRLGESYTLLAEQVSMAENLILIIVVAILLILAYFYRHRYIHHIKRINRITLESTKKLTNQAVSKVNRPKKKKRSRA